MAEFRWIQMLSFLILMLQFKAATTGQNTSIFVVRDGDEKTLPCGHSDCGRTQWTFKGVTSTDIVQLFINGMIVEEAKNKSDRLRVTADCSLLIKNITVGDVGCYTCRHFPSLHNQQQYADIHLSVINMTEHENNGEVTLFCSVLDFDKCAHTVQWIYEGEDKPSDMKISARSCTATVTFTISDLNQRSKFYELLKCNVMNQNSETVQLFPYSHQSSGSALTDEGPSLLFIIAPVCLAALLIVAVIIWKKTKGKKTQVEENAGQSLNPAGTPSAPGSHQDTDDPEDDVNYVSINHTRNALSNTRAQVHDDEGDTVTYSAVTAPSPYLKVSTDPNDLYSTINK
ncbi:uncharacterized protein LOC115774728 isoform X2 [Archocentrus centrarchus]|uniref:uncharacterized protein LOC115774728 isoform X2 n=1 Tax=Archocentrus centrarchus TaxID=63155 RepID=UPI0011E9CB69|nr:uncharacterized protein LOC115774728 isoform X2 [Archocentrus centrarchus]